jgi:putative glutamine amidotransferase
VLKIGLSSCFFHADPVRPIFKGKTLIYSEQSMAHWVMSQGAVAYLIPSIEAGGPVSLKDLAQGLDGLVLQGGSDVAPGSYGQKPLKPEWGGDAIRDAYEQALLKEFMNQGKPVLGVCRGAQLINVAFGGTLYQDIEMQAQAALNHRNWEIYDQNFHEIAFEKGTRLSQLYPGMTRAKVNTVHHQAVKDLGKGLIVEAHSPEDGIIEAIRLKDPAHSVFAVQWHPEFHDSKDASLLKSAPILADFLKEAQTRRR